MIVKIDVHAVHIHVHTEASPLLEQILEETQAMSDAVNRLQADITNLTSINQSAIALITGLAQQVRDNATDPAALNALADQLEASSSELASAVTANTTASAGDPAAPGDAGGTAGGSTGSGDSPTVSADANAGDGTATGEPTSSAAPAGATDGAGTSALDPTVDAGAGEDATQAQLDNEGDGSVVTP